MPEICHIGAAVNAKFHITACFWATLGLSLLALIGAFLLTLLGKNGASLFLVASCFWAVLSSVVGTTGKISLQGVTALVKAARR